MVTTLALHRHLICLLYQWSFDDHPLLNDGASWAAPICLTGSSYVLRLCLQEPWTSGLRHASLGSSNRCTFAVGKLKSQPRTSIPSHSWTTVDTACSVASFPWSLEVWCYDQCQLRWRVTLSIRFDTRMTSASGARCSIRWSSEYFVKMTIWCWTTNAGISHLVNFDCE